MSGVSITGAREVEAALDKIAKGVAGSRDKPVYVGTTLFYGRFQNRGTRRGVRPVRFLERGADAITRSARYVLKSKLATGDVLSALVGLAQRARNLARRLAPRRRGKLRRSLRVQVGGTLRRP